MPWIVSIKTPFPQVNRFSFVVFFKRDTETAPLHHQNGHHMLPAQQQHMDPYRNPSTVDFDGRVVHSRSGDIIGKNSAV